MSIPEEKNQRSGREITRFNSKKSFRIKYELALRLKVSFHSVTGQIGTKKQHWKIVKFITEPHK